MSIKLDKKVGKIRQETTDIDWDDFKVFLERKGLADSTVQFEVFKAKRVIKEQITEENMYEKCIHTKYVRNHIRRSIRYISKYKNEVKRCQ